MNNVFVVCAVVVCLIGCNGEAKPEPDASVVVTGLVTLDGKPLDRATIIFVPLAGAAQGNGGSGITDSAGKYELSSLVGEKAVVGTPPGKYKVMVTKMVKPDGTVADAQEPPMMSAARETIPLQYSDFAVTKLSETVSSSGGTFNFDLKSK